MPLGFVPPASVVLPSPGGGIGPGDLGSAPVRGATDGLMTVGMAGKLGKKILLCFVFKENKVQLPAGEESNSQGEVGVILSSERKTSTSTLGAIARQKVIQLLSILKAEW